jgi:hypothetical protein
MVSSKKQGVRGRVDSFCVAIGGGYLPPWELRLRKHLRNHFSTAEGYRGCTPEGMPTHRAKVSSRLLNPSHGEESFAEGLA